MKGLLTLFLSLLLITSVSQARSKRKSHSKKHRKTINKRYSFTYDQVWFASLTDQQQLVYLKTLKKLADQLSRTSGKYAFDHFIMDSLFPSVFASGDDNVCSESNISKNISKCVISNGYIRPNGGSDPFKSFFDSKNFGLLKPNCPSGQPCAPYLGLVAGNPPVLTCSPDVTAKCNGNLSLLTETLTSCKNNKPSAEYCTTLTEEMEKSTESLKAWCSKVSSNRAVKRACDAALKALEKEKISPAPVETDPFQRGNCKRLADKLISIKQKNRDTREAGRAAYNNQFWNNMSYVARKICSNNTAGTSQAMGLCDVSPKVQNKYEEEKTLEKGDAGFDECKKQRIQALEAEFEKNKRKINRQIEIKNQKIKEVKIRLPTIRNALPEKNAAQRQLEILEGNKAELEQELLDMETDHNSKLLKDKNLKCKVTHTIAQNIPDVSDSKKFNTILRSLKTGDLHKDSGDENVFKSYTGLSSKKFKNTFCKDKNSDQLRNHLKDISPPEINALQDDDGNYATNALSSHKRLKTCLNNLKTMEQAGCKFKLWDGNSIPILEMATSFNPILIQKKNEPNKCRLISSYEEVEKKDELNHHAGEYDKIKKDKIVFEAETSRKISTDEHTLEWIAENYNIQAYSCTGESLFHYNSPEKRNTIDPVPVFETSQ